MLVEESVACLHYDDFQRLAIDVRVEDVDVGFYDTVRVLIDTGAATMLLSANNLFLTERQRRYVELYGKEVQTSGVVSGVSVKAYRFNVSRFCVGQQIALLDFPVNISFDPRMQRNLLGMSFLKLFDVHMVAAKAVITFKALPSTNQLVTGKYSVRNIDNAPIYQAYLDTLNASVFSDLSVADTDEVQPLRF